MNDSCRVTVKPLAVRLAYLTALASLAVSSSVYAISFGHSRLLSPVGQPLQIQVRVHDLTDQERGSLSVSVAPTPAWQEAGLTPPVDPATMQIAVVDGVRPGSKVVTVRSSQPLATDVADLLLAVRSSSGQMQHQVSLLAPADLEVARASGGVTASGSGAVGAPGSNAQAPIQIRRGDTLFALARRYAVPGVSVYQWMIGVMQANPQAFINDNVNLIKAGATLNVPAAQQLTALSDREARAIFQKHATAFAQYRQRLAGEVARAEPAAAAQPADSGGVTVPAAETAPAPTAQRQDRLVLQSAQAATTAGSASAGAASSVTGDAADAEGGQSVVAGGQNSGQGAAGQTEGAAVGTNAASSLNNDDQLALERNTEEARERVNQLEENVKNLNQALQQQGTAAHEAVVEGAKTVEDTVEQLKKIVDGDTSGTTATSANGSTDEGGGTGAQTVEAQSAGGQTAGTKQNASEANGTSGVVAGLNESATASSAASSNEPAASSNDAASTSSDNDTGSRVATSSNGSSSTSSWFMDNLLIVISAALALIVLIVAWLLRRVGAERDDDADAVITEEMVRERLQSINLDLDDTSENAKPEQRI
ncbi:MAG: hypothetical protein CML17_05210 [Pusillimonas sp.]|nr:hypothetical protein [Pusillimonas sp.]